MMRKPLATLCIVLAAEAGVSASTATVTTPDFVITVDGPRTFAQNVSKAAAKASIAMKQLFNIDDAEFRNPVFSGAVDVRVFEDYEDFRRDFEDNFREMLEMGVAAVPGAYFALLPQGRTGRYRRVIRAYKGDSDADEATSGLLHEMGHLFLHSYLQAYGSTTPSWLDEGIAQYFEYMTMTGLDIGPKRDGMRAMVHEAVKTGASMPVADIMKISNMENLDISGRDRVRSLLQYAQSYALIDMLVRYPRPFSTMLERYRRMQSRSYRLSEAVDANNRNLARLIKMIYGWDDKRLADEFEKYVQRKYGLAVAQTAGMVSIGNFYLAQEDWKTADDWYDKAIKRRRATPEAYVGKSRVWLGLEKPDKALECIDAALAMDRHAHPDVVGMKAEVLLSTGDYQQALEVAREALKAQRNNRIASTAAGEACLMLEDYAAAAGYFEAYLGNQSEAFDLEVIYLLGMCRYMAGEYKQAVAPLHRVVKFAPWPGTAIYCAAAMANSGNKADALKYLAPFSGYDEVKELTQRVNEGKLPVRPGWEFHPGKDLELLVFGSDIIGEDAARKLLEEYRRK